MKMNLLSLKFSSGEPTGPAGVNTLPGFHLLSTDGRARLLSGEKLQGFNEMLLELEAV